MNNNQSFHQMVSSFFLKYIPERTSYSVNTIKAYRDTFKLLLRFYNTERHLKPSKLSFDCITRTDIESFLTWLEVVRNYSLSSSNLRLSALHAFFRYVLAEAPEYIDLCTSILTMKTRKVPKCIMTYLSIDAIKALLSSPSTKDAKGRREMAILVLLYDSGARVQELADLSIGDFRTIKPYTVKITGKGSKSRVVPIMPQTGRIIEVYLTDKNRSQVKQHDLPLFCNKQGRKLTRAGINYILKKHVTLARHKYPLLFPTGITAHAMRHSKAMHLLEGGVNLIYIRDFLGHASVITTEIYAKSNPEIMRKALETVASQVAPQDTFSLKEKVDLFNWLDSIV